MRVTGKSLAAASAAVLVAAGLPVWGVVSPAAAGTVVSRSGPASSPASGPSHARFLRARKAAALSGGEQQVCAAPSKPGVMQCMAIHSKPAGSTQAAPAGNPGGLAPSDLQAAYSIRQAAAKDGKGRTVAIVDAYSDPNAAKDLKAYRKQFHLPACGTSGGCLKIVNEYGNASLPPANSGWAFEESLDLDMVSAICPNCHILLIEARSASIADLGIAENTAVAKGIKIISNSWNSGGEFTGQQGYEKDFNHPGVAIAFAAGDTGYGTAFPTDTQYVTAVGGTALRRASNARGWSENAWIGTGSGCSTLEAKPSWQSADDTAGTGCLNRTENDVAAVASPNTAVAIYDSYKDGPSWAQAGGTSVATPVIAGVYALAGNPTPSTYPAQYPYRHTSSFYDVTTGSNGSCGSTRQYLCNGEKGYDGPTGLGTPDGTAGFSVSGTPLVTLVDPGTQDVAEGGAFSLQITGLDANSGGKLGFTATGLPAGLTIGPGAATDATITGTLPGTAGSYPVTVTGTDAKTGRYSRISFAIVTSASLTELTPTWPTPPISGPIRFTGTGGGCLDGNLKVTPPAPVLNQACDTSEGQQWTLAAGSSPAAAAQLKIVDTDQCLGESDNKAVLNNCGQVGTFWLYLGLGELVNRATGVCLALPKAALGQQADTVTCSGGAAQQWDLTTNTITSGVSGLCLTAGTSPAISVTACSGTPATMANQQWDSGPAGSLVSASGGLCMDAGKSMLAAAPAGLSACESVSKGNFDQVWVPGPGGELINALSGKCLDDPSGGGAGTALVQNDCYGTPGEIWAIN